MRRCTSLVSRHQMPLKAITHFTGTECCPLAKQAALARWPNNTDHNNNGRDHSERDCLCGYARADQKVSHIVTIIIMSCHVLPAVGVCRAALVSTMNHFLATNNAITQWWHEYTRSKQAEWHNRAPSVPACHLYWPTGHHKGDHLSLVTTCALSHWLSCLSSLAARVSISTVGGFIWHTIQTCRYLFTNSCFNCAPDWPVACDAHKGGLMVTGPQRFNDEFGVSFGAISAWCQCRLVLFVCLFWFDRDSRLAVCPSLASCRLLASLETVAPLWCGKQLANSSVCSLDNAASGTHNSAKQWTALSLGQSYSDGQCGPHKDTNSVATSDENELKNGQIESIWGMRS